MRLFSPHSTHARRLLILIFIPVVLLGTPMGKSRGEELTEMEKAVHVLNRLGFGPRPGDVERVLKMGVDAYTQKQLHPESIDDSVLKEKLSIFPTLSMNNSELMKDFYQEIQRFVQKQKEDGKDLKAIQNYNGTSSEGSQPPNRGKFQATMKDAPKRMSLRVVGELQTAKIMTALESEAQLNEVLVDFWSNHFNIDVKKGPCRVLKVTDEREVIRPNVLGKFRTLLAASARSPAMLFYLDNNQNSAPREMSLFEQKVRAKFYTQRTGLPPPDEMQSDDQPKMDGGLNENYGREIMELHTLGVDGGYSQKDVQEVARCFTGWAMNPLTSEFAFNPRRHDQGEKIVLGHTIPANGGIKDGEIVLDILSGHPSTARHISKKLCRRFISDNPPQSAVDRAAEVFLKTEGDLRKVVESIITSPEFFAREAYRSKIKSPFEFAVSAVRAADGHLNEQDPVLGVALRSVLEGSATIGFGQEFVSKFRHKSLNWHIFEMGEPLYSFQAPTGYPEDSQKWVSTGALISRLNFAMALTGQTLSDVRIPLRKLMTKADIDQPGHVIDHLLEELVPGQVSEGTRKVLLQQTQGNDSSSHTVNAEQLVALILGSPEFQRR